MLVDFNKGPAASYDAEAHSNGIYQCTDTGDTYIFGIKNGSKSGLISSEDLPETHKNLIKDILNSPEDPTGEVLPSWQAFVDSVTWSTQSQSINFYEGPISSMGLVKGLGFMNTALCCLSWASSGSSKEALFIVYSPNTSLGMQASTNMVQISDGVPFFGSLTSAIIANESGIQLICNQSQKSSSINTNFDKQLNFSMNGDGTKYLNDNGKYTSLSYPMVSFPFTEWTKSGIPDNYIQPLTDAFTSGKLICLELTEGDDKTVIPVNWKKVDNLYRVYLVTQGMDTQGEFQITILTLGLNLSEKTATPMGMMPLILKYGGSGNKYLSDAGEYRDLPTKVTDPDILSRLSTLESELQGVNALADEILTLTE